MSETIRALVEELNKASYAYYNTGNPIMTDKEWDEKYEQLQKLEEETGIVFSASPTQTVGTETLNYLEKIKIEPKPMLSLQKTFGFETLYDFVIDNGSMLAMTKCDGLSVRLIYENGKLVSANTRGDGYVGTNITEHIKHFLNVPLVIPHKSTYIIDGEAVIKVRDFNIVNKDGIFKNPRNAAAGALNLLDMEEVTTRRLSFIAWDIIQGATDTCLDYMLEEARKFGFEVVPYAKIVAYQIQKFDMEYIKKANALVQETSLKMGIPMDGVVWKINYTLEGRKLGHTSHHFNDALAWKPDRECVETTLKTIEWTMGRTGVLTPVAIFEPVELLGSTVERASLHNVSVMRELLNIPYKGQKIWVYKANMIIPQIDHADTDGLTIENQFDQIPFPIVCPICGQPVELKENNDVKTLVCGNPACDGKLVNRLDHFCGKKGLDIRGLSKSTLEKLIDWGWLSSYLDIFHLAAHGHSWAQRPGFGSKSVNNILDAINTAKVTTDDKFLAALGIPLIGTSASKEIFKREASYVSFREDVANGFDFSAWDGFGPEMNDSIHRFDFTEADKIYSLLQSENVLREDKNVEKELKDVKVCVTGTLSFGSRNAFKEFVEASGGKVVSSVSSATTCLIANKPETSSKYKSAEKLNIPILTEEEFFERFGLEF